MKAVIGFVISAVAAFAMQIALDSAFPKDTERMWVIIAAWPVAFLWSALIWEPLREWRDQDAARRAHDRT